MRFAKSTSKWNTKQVHAVVSFYSAEINAIRDLMHLGSKAYKRAERDEKFRKQQQVIARRKVRERNSKSVVEAADRATLDGQRQNLPFNGLDAFVEFGLDPRPPKFRRRS